MLRLMPRITQEVPTTLLDAGLPPHLARVLWARGVRTRQEADVFLSPQVQDLHDPLLLRGMDVAVARIRAALAAGEQIVIYGDYDVDGVCAASILVEALRAQGGQVDWYIPSRHREGYGLNEDAVRSIAERAQLLVTVDCGITSVQEAKLAAELGLDLIITDHHEPPEQLPQALALIDPLLGDYPFRRLCGAGVAFKVVWALFGEAAVEPLWELAALATVADLVPLLGENRIIVKEGLRRMQSTGRAGLKALIAAAGQEGKVLTSGHLGFQIGPRINAGGRLYEASRIVELLLTDDREVAARIARELDTENAERRRMETDILGQAERWVLENVDFLQEHVLIVVGKGWNTGVVGLAASRLVERFAWPTLVLSENDEGMVTGSARSIPGVNIHSALTLCADLFVRFGGHAQAAGMTLAAENLPALRERLNAAVLQVAEPDAFVPSATYDLDITLPEVDIALVEQFDQLAPTGFGNPSPIFLATGAQVLEARSVGADGKHLKLRLGQADAALDGIAFGQGAARAGLAQQVDVLFSPSINEYMGRRSAQCQVERLLPHAPLEAFRAQCAARQDDFDCYLLDHAPGGAETPEEPVLRALITQALTDTCQGTLLTVKTLAGAERWLAWLREAGLENRLDYCFEMPTDIRRFNTLCALPKEAAVTGYARVFALDDLDMPQAAQTWLPTDDALRDLYRVLRAAQGRFQSERAVAEAARMRVGAVRLGLLAFDELDLIDYQPVPFLAMLRPAKKCSLDESETLSRVRSVFMRKEEA